SGAVARGGAGGGAREHHTGLCGRHPCHGQGGESAWLVGTVLTSQSPRFRAPEQLSVVVGVICNRPRSPQHPASASRTVSLQLAPLRGLAERLGFGLVGAADYEQ